MLLREITVEDRLSWYATSFRREDMEQNMHWRNWLHLAASYTATGLYEIKVFLPDYKASLIKVFIFTLWISNLYEIVDFLWEAKKTEDNYIYWLKWDLFISELVAQTNIVKTLLYWVKHGRNMVQEDLFHVDSKASFSYSGES